MVIYQKEVKNIHANLTELVDLSDYTKGLYLVKVKQTDTVHVGRLVVR